ncbi:hypothetical protein K9M41_00750 [Candidatus Gracilibacteria bacterium]|nr:hypothetical protein [Candidatus Gracilibacteria bacterium]
MKKLIFVLSFLFFGEMVLATSVPPVFTGGVLPGPVTNSEGIIGNDGSGRVTGTAGATGQDYVVENLIPGISNGFIMAFLAVCVVMIIIAGVYFVFSSGDSEMKQKAKDIIFWVAVAAVLAMLAVAIVRFVIGLNFSFSV